MRASQSLGLLAKSLVALVVVGCARRSLLEKPIDWPAEWSGRQLYAHTSTFAYATSAPAAAEADELASRVAKSFQVETSRPAPIGLIIVTDRGDPTPVSDTAVLAQLINRREQALGLDDTDKQAEGAGDLNDDEGTRTIEADLPGVKLDGILSILPCIVTPADRTESLGLPAHVSEQCPWTVMLPTHRLCRRVAADIVDAALKREEVGLLARLAIAPWRPLIESIAADQFAAERERVLFEAFIHGQSDWSDVDKRARIAEFRRKHTAASQQQLESRVGQALQSKSPASQPAAGPDPTEPEP